MKIKKVTNQRYSQEALSGLFQAVSQVFGLGFEDLISRKRDLDHNLARTAFIKLFRDDQQVSHKTTGRILRRSRSTIRHLYKQHDMMWTLNYKGYRFLFQEVVDEYKGFIASQEQRKESKYDVRALSDAGESPGEDVSILRQVS